MDIWDPVRRAREIRLRSAGFGALGQRFALVMYGAGGRVLSSPDDFCRLLAEGGSFVIRYDQCDMGFSAHAHSDYEIFILLADSLVVMMLVGSALSCLILQR